MIEQIFKRDEFFVEVWDTALTALAKKYGLSDNGIRMICVAMNISLPRVGHWAKAAVGKHPPGQLYQQRIHILDDD